MSIGIFARRKYLCRYFNGWKLLDSIMPYTFRNTNNHIKSTPGDNFENTMNYHHTFFLHNCYFNPSFNSSMSAFLQNFYVSLEWNYKERNLHEVVARTIIKRRDKINELVEEKKKGKKENACNSLWW